MRSKSKFTPFVVYDVYAFVKTEALAAGVCEDGYHVVRHSPHGYVDVLTIATAQIPARWGAGTADPVKCANRLGLIALRDGATPEAIRLLGQITPISANEELYMAEKLKGKKTADKAGLKEAAAKTPIAKTAKVEKTKAPETGTKPRGNPEALKKAREARAANKGPDLRKIKLLVKPKDSNLRAGSDRLAKLEFMVGKKTVSEVLGEEYAPGKKLDAGALAGMVKRGHISLS